MAGAVTLGEHLRDSIATRASDLPVVVEAIAHAGALIATELVQAALARTHGVTGDTNVHGESVQRLDVHANNVVLSALGRTGLVCTLASEELEEVVHLHDRCAGARYVVCFDPVDGSSNLEVNGPVGTIFSIRPRTPDTDHATRDILAPGTSQVAAGYIVNGPATVLVLTTGDGVDAFTLEPVRGEFLLTHQGIRMPPRGRIYSVNEGNSTRWDASVRRYVESLRTAGSGPGRPYAGRYIGALVADFHRTLLSGGIFLYPPDVTGRQGPVSKLRLLYEAAPLGLVAEQAGGRASTGSERILDVVPTIPHQRVPLIIGSAEDVIEAEDFIAGRR
jgi:fructose-1,6-bisphosphatase I